MAVIVVCAVLVLGGLAVVVRWGGLMVQPPPSPAADATAGRQPPPVGLVVRRYLWGLTVAVAAGVGAGILAAGAGGRLVMRLLAVTAGPDAHGQITEADQVVGRTSVDGTLEFLVFTGVVFGLASGAADLLIRRWLPAGRLGGLAYGVLLLVCAGTRLEPLRVDNLDFDLVGPGWVAVAAFSTLVVFHGMLVAALAGRLSRAVPLLARDPRAVAGHAPLLLLVPLPPVVVALTVIGALVVLATRARPLVAAWRAPRLRLAGQAVLALAALVALPGFVGAVAGILARG
jgi:hypothetical protein